MRLGGRGERKLCTLRCQTLTSSSQSARALLPTTPRLLFLFVFLASLAILLSISFPTLCCFRHWHEGAADSASGGTTSERRLLAEGGRHGIAPTCHMHLLRRRSVREEKLRTSTSAAARFRQLGESRVRAASCSLLLNSSIVGNSQIKVSVLESCTHPPPTPNPSLNIQQLCLTLLLCGPFR